MPRKIISTIRTLLVLNCYNSILVRWQSSFCGMLGIMFANLLDLFVDFGGRLMTTERERIIIVKWVKRIQTEIMVEI